MAVTLPNGKVFISVENIITYGLTKEENDFILKNLPTKNYELYATDTITDLIVIPAVAVVINVSKLDSNNIDILNSFYTDINGCTSEAIIWIGNPKPSKEIQKFIKCYENFDGVKDNIKYILLNAHKQNKKANEFSRNIMYALKILCLIRKKTGITTKELAETCEISTRSVQRYIETLRVSGEWIEYDTSLKGWKLYKNKSILIGEIFDEEFKKK